MYAGFVLKDIPGKIQTCSRHKYISGGSTLNDQEKEIKKYKEQSLGKKKKGQLAPEPEKYKIDKEKMIGHPGMLTKDEKRNFIISAMARKFGTIGLLAFIIGPLGSLLSLGFVWVVYSKYVLGSSFNDMVDKFYRPFIFTCMIIFAGIFVLSWLVHHFVYSDKKALIIRADDKLVEAGMEPVEIPRADKDKNALIEAFYHIKTPYFIANILIIAAVICLIFESIIVYQAAAKQKTITDSARKATYERIDKSLEGMDHTSSHKVMSFVDRLTFRYNGHINMIIDLNADGTVLDASYMIRYTGKYKVSELDKLKSEGVRSEFQALQDTTKDYKDLFVYPTVTEVPVKFSDYMLNYIDNIREKSEWEGNQECKIDNDEYVMHCKVSYNEGKNKSSQDDDRMTVIYNIQKKNFKRTQW